MTGKRQLTGGPSQCLRPRCTLSARQPLAAPPAEMKRFAERKKPGTERKGGGREKIKLAWRVDVRNE